MAASDATPVPVKNQAWRFTFAIRKADGSLVTGWTGADSEISKDQGAFADCTNEATEIGSSGIGYLDVTATETNCNNFIIKVSVTNTDALVLDFHFHPTTGSDIPVNVAAISSDTAAADNLELQFDGTGLTGDNYPATQAELAAAVSTSTDIFNVVDARLPATLSGGRIRADMEAISTDVTAATNAEAFFDGTGYAGTNNVIPTVTTVTNGTGATVQNIFEADPADYDADADSFAARFLAVKTKTDTITDTVTYVGPVAEDGEQVTLYQTSDYSATTQTVSFTSTSTMTLTSGVPKLTFNGNTFTGSTVSGSSGNWTLAFTLTSAQTSALKIGVFDFQVKVLVSGELTPALVEGKVTVKRHLGE